MYSENTHPIYSENTDLYTARELQKNTIYSVRIPYIQRETGKKWAFRPLYSERAFSINIYHSRSYDRKISTT